MVAIYDVLKASKGIHVDDTFAELWGRKLSNAYTVATYSGTLPATLQTVEGYLESYKIYGNTVQEGMPTPENPIVPSGCGERVDVTGLSEPLCGIQTYVDSLSLSTGVLMRRIKKLVITGKESWEYESAYERFSTRIEGMYAESTRQTPIICTHYSCIYDGRPIGDVPYNSVYIGASGQLASILLVKTSDYTTVARFKAYLAQQYANGTPVTIWYVLIEPETATVTVPSELTGTIEGYLNQEGTPTPETPIYPTAYGVKQADGTYSISYGYKLPILSNSTVTNIYLGEVETTRRIKKLVLTGEEEWAIDSGRFTIILNDIKSQGLRLTEFYCSSYQVISDGRAYADVPNNAIYTGAGSSASVYIYIHTDAYTTIKSFKAYLAQQLTNGTPVTIWYPLKTPTTGTLNEPLMKIGVYADTIDSTQASTQIPTAAGETTISWAGEGLAPSEVELTYRKPKGQ